MSEPYGGKGCNCWPVEGEWGDARYLDTPCPAWHLNAFCPHHGVLAEYTPPRMDTGTYRVVGRKGEDYAEPAVDHGIPSEECEAGSCDCAGQGEPVLPSPAVIEEETGVFATVRRAWRNWRRGSGCCDRV